MALYRNAVWNLAPTSSHRNSRYVRTYITTLATQFSLRSHVSCGKIKYALSAQHPECLPISVNTEDSFFGRLGVRCLEFVRSGSAPKENCEFGSREQLSQVTSYLDASTVYSSNAFQSDALRLFRNGSRIKHNL